MGECYSPLIDHEQFDQSWKIIKHPLVQPRTSPWFDLRIFYMSFSNFDVDESTPEYLTLNHIPLSPDTIFEVNGRRSSSYTESVSSTLRSDRVDKKNKEATFVSTDNIRMTGSARFDVYDKDDLLFSGVLELSNSNGFVGESKSNCKRWSLSCQQMMTSDNVFLKVKQLTGPELLPIVDVYVTGCFSGVPIILTKTIQLGSRKNYLQKAKLNYIPENEFTEMRKDVSSKVLQETRYQGHEAGKDDVEVDYDSLYMRGEYLEGEDGELSWFNAGVRVGLGIGLGVCLGVGLGVGLLVLTYQATSRHLKRRLV